jgi:hypothetical protein
MALGQASEAYLRVGNVLLDPALRKLGGFVIPGRTMGFVGMGR